MGNSESRKVGNLNSGRYSKDTKVRIPTERLDCDIKREINDNFSDYMKKINRKRRDEGLPKKDKVEFVEDALLNLMKFRPAG